MKRKLVFLITFVVVLILFKKFLCAYEVIDLSDELVGFDEHEIRAIASDGNIFLIGGTGGRLNKYDGNDFTDLTKQLNFGEYNINTIASNGVYFLIGGAEGRLFKYDGKEFSDLTNLAGKRSILSICPSSDFFLIGGAKGQLYKYDGKEFINLTGRAGDQHIRSIATNNEYFLIGGNGPTLYKYDPKSNTFINLSKKLVKFNSKAIYSISWNGKFWLIGGSDGDINKYDGIKFTNLGIPDFHPKADGVDPEDLGRNTLRVITAHRGYFIIAGSGSQLHKYDVNFKNLRGLLLRFGVPRLGHEVSALRANIGGKDVVLRNFGTGIIYSVASNGVYILVGGIDGNKPRLNRILLP